MIKLRIIILGTILLVQWGCKRSVPVVTTAPLTALSSSVQDLPASDYVDMNGNAVSLSDYKGKKLLVNYWATWCRPCIEEMPSLIRTQALLKNENYVFLLPSDQSLETIKKFVDRKQYDLTFIRYTGSLAEVGIRALPTTFIYNEAGELVEKIVGSTEWDSPEMIRKLKDIR